LNIKGLDPLHKHLPEIDTAPGCLRLFGLAALLFIGVTAFFIVEDLSNPFWLLDGEVVLGSLGFALLFMFYRVKANYSARFGPLAYHQAIRRFGFPGLGIILAVVARIGYMPGPGIPPFRWNPALPAFGCVLLAAGGVLLLRSVHFLGVDNLAMLYVYFPSESLLVGSNIYAILRHPMYGALQTIALGLALVNGNWFALTCALVFMLGVWSWARMLEEKELLERLGAAYAEYRRRVPAFWPRPRALGRFLKFLLSGG
jgi:protein-S-isoprenylcysteine O-methyltransferase Ste14